MTRFLLYMLLLATGLCSAQQNLNENYTPLKSSGRLPEFFTTDVRGVIQQDITDLRKAKEKDRSLKTNFLTASNYQLQKIVRSGDMLVNDEISSYLDKIADEILKDDPALRRQLNIYTLKSPVVNAYSFDKGFIFIDIGLIAQVESEAQLAFILSHEIAHFTKKHNINSYVKNAQIDRKNYDGRDSEDRLIEKCQYSKENESEADEEGFKIYEKANYNLRQAASAFDMLQYAHLPFELVRFNKSFFETPGFTIPSYYFLKEESPIKDNSMEDDTKHTHPNTAKRKALISNMIVGKNNNRKINSVLGQEKFEYIRDLSRMEIRRLYLKRRDYPNALYAAYILSAKYPNNQYLAEIISKSLYGITLYNRGIIHYNDDSYLDKGLANYTDVESFPQQLYYMIFKMPSNEWTFLSLNYVYRAHKKFPGNKKLEVISDSLFQLTASAKWGAGDFARTTKPGEVKNEVKKDTVIAEDEPSSKTKMIASIQKEKQEKISDTLYYKNMFADLFENDPEFNKKFPERSTSQDDLGSSFGTYSNNDDDIATSRKKSRNISTVLKIEKVLLLEPFYIKIDENQREAVQYITSDQKQEDYIRTVNQCAGLLDFGLVTLDPGLVKSDEVDKLNDFAVINDWFDEKFDSNDRRKLIMNTDDIENIIAKYGTSYVLRTGLATIVTRSGKKATVFYGFLFNIKNNTLVYRKYEEFSTKDHMDLVHAKTYQMLFELKHPSKN